MRPRLLPVLLSVALLASCSGGGRDVAATVNGTDITVADIQAMRVSDESGTVDKTAFAADLTSAIINLAVNQAVLEEFAIDPTEEEVEDKIEQMSKLISTAQGVTLEEFLEAQRLTEDQFRTIARQQVIRDKLHEHFEPDAVPPTDADVQLLRNSQGLGLITACLSHILVATEEEANAAKARIEGGEDFAAVASEVGTDGTAASGGDLSCQQLSVFVPEFGQAAADAELNVISGPVETEFGWHVLLVRERTGPPSNDELKDRITSDRVNQLVDAWLLQTMSEAEVEVNASYGSWVTEPVPQVVAPSG